MVPLLIVQANVAPAWGGTDAVFAVEAEQTAEAAVMVEFGSGLTVNVIADVPVQPLASVTVTV
jgi:hypothetical protein